MTRTISEIQQNILEQLHWDSRVDASNVDVAVNERGHAALTGQVLSHFARQAAVTITALVPGVTAVDNQLTIQSSNGRVIPTDNELQRNILDMLDWNPDIDISDIEVSVDRGWVTLQGSVDAYWKKTQADNLIFSQIGAVGVRNKIAVVPSGSIADEAIAQNIIKLIDRSAVIPMNDIDVKVEDHVVNLKGEAPSWRAYRTLYDIVKYTIGVREIEDEMSVISAF